MALAESDARERPVWPGRLLLALYLVSGAAGLAYEILWTRMLSIQFGVSIFGVVITVSAFMLGLGLGSLAGSRVFALNPLRVFAALECGVALLALAMPLVLQGLDHGLQNVSPHVSLGLWYGIQFVVIFLVLLLPALAMGFGFPLVLRVIRLEPQGLARLYGLNSIGGALGALLPLLLLPMLGWLDSMRTVALVSLGVALAAWLLARRELFVEAAAVPFAPRVATFSAAGRGTLIAYAGVGAGALVLEIAWTRLFGMVMLRTEYVLAVILAVFLLGVGAGSLVARNIRSPLWLMVLPSLAVACVVAGLWLLPVLSAALEGIEYSSLTQALLIQAAAIAVLTLPVTVILGAWLPLLASRFERPHEVGPVLYGVNSLGASLGVMAAGFVLIPSIGSTMTLLAGALLLAVSGWYWARSYRVLGFLALCGIAAVPVMTLPQAADLLPELYADSRDVYQHEDTLSITQVVERADGQRVLLADLRRMDASSEPVAVESQKNQARLPLLLHPEPQSVLFLGLGTGISAAGSLGFPGLSRTAVELSAGAIDAARHWFAPVNGDIARHVRIVRDDARHHLQAHHETYDVIVGDLFHPDLIGRSALLSVQQFARAKGRLSEDGVFVQWIALNQFDVASLRVVLRSFREVFPDAVIFLDSFRLALVGYRDHGNSASSAILNAARMTDATVNDVTGGEGVWTWVGRYWGTLPDDPGVVQDEWAPRIEFDLPQARYAGRLDLVHVLAYLASLRPVVEDAAAQLQLDAGSLEAFRGAYQATGLAQQSWQALLRGQNDEGQRLLRAAYALNPSDRWIGMALADGALAVLPQALREGVDAGQLLEAILRIRPDHPEALRELWHLERDRGNETMAEMYRERLRALSPLSADFRADRLK